jgi:hypothetical protein
VQCHISVNADVMAVRTMAALLLYYGFCAAVAAAIYYGFSFAVAAQIGLAVRVADALKPVVGPKDRKGQVSFSNENAPSSSHLAA